MRAIAFTVFLLSLALFAASFLGAWHGVGDSLAVFRHWWAVAAGVSSLVLFRGSMRLAAAGLLAVFVSAAPIMAGWFETFDPAAGKYSFYQKNLLFEGSRPDAILADIRATNPDFVALEEVSPFNKAIFDALAATYPARQLCPDGSSGSVAILSRHPPVPGTATCLGNNGLAAVRVVTPDGPVWAVALHLKWPFPRKQSRQVKEMVPELRALGGPVVLGGDFNMVPWSHTMRQIERATGSTRAGAVQFTFHHLDIPLFLPIDHILVPSGQGQLETRPLLGSDHKGLLLRFNL